MIKYLIVIISLGVNNLLHSQNEVIELKGTLVYHGDYFFFFPNKNPKELLQTSESDGIMMNGICAENIFKYTKAFRRYELNVSPNEVNYLENKWRTIYISKVKISLELESIQTDKNNPYLTLGFVYNDQNIKLIGSKLVNHGATIIKSYGRNFDPKEVEKELEITPPDVLDDC